MSSPAALLFADLGHMVKQPFVRLECTDEQGQHRPLLVKHSLSSRRLCVVVTDLLHVYAHETTLELLATQLEYFNPSLSPAEPVRFAAKRLVADLQQPSSNTQFQIAHTFEGLKLTLTELMQEAKFNFCWQFQCVRGDPEHYSQQVLQPVLTLLAEQSVRAQQLTSLLGSKDAEIKDLRSGSFSQATTAPFDRARFEATSFWKPPTDSIDPSWVFGADLVRLQQVVLSHQFSDASQEQAISLETLSSTQTTLADEMVIADCMTFSAAAPTLVQPQSQAELEAQRRQELKRKLESEAQAERERLKKKRKKIF